jgi:hypothetical protein
MIYDNMMKNKYVAICHPEVIDKPMKKWFNENEYKIIFSMTIDKLADEIEKWYAETFDVEIPEAQIIEDTIHVYDTSFSIFKLTCPIKEHEAEGKDNKQ